LLQVSSRTGRHETRSSQTGEDGVYATFRRFFHHEIHIVLGWSDFPFRLIVSSYLIFWICREKPVLRDKMEYTTGEQ
jgi:hypothetical protein